MSEDAFEFLELDGREVGHVSGYHLVLEERELLGDGRADQAELV